MKVHNPSGASWPPSEIALASMSATNSAAQQPERAKQLAEAWEAWAKRARVYPVPKFGAWKKKK
ncbi:MAG TPA: hypothetical protein QF764_12995 [Planctomycetota bacterium]|nr:hypothetical protein [Planctomycetota bacterium]